MQRYIFYFVEAFVVISESVVHDYCFSQERVVVDTGDSFFNAITGLEVESCGLRRLLLKDATTGFDFEVGPPSSQTPGANNEQINESDIEYEAVEYGTIEEKLTEDQKVSTKQVKPQLFL